MVRAGNSNIPPAATRNAGVFKAKVTVTFDPEALPPVFQDMSTYRDLVAYDGVLPILPGCQKSL